MTDRPVDIPGHMPSSFDEAEQLNEKPIRKIVRRLKEEPLVPLGIGLTVFAFVNASRALRRGDSQQANRMFRARVAAQGFTVVAMLAGSIYYQKDREKNKELRQLQEQKDAEEKRQRWIRELEIRDEEEKAIKARLQSRVASSTKPEEKEEEAEKKKQDKKTGGTGGVLGGMGLWESGQKTAAKQEEAHSEERTGERSRRGNPQSSLGAIGESMKKKDE